MSNKVIPYGRQNIVQDDIDAVISTLTGDFLTQGPQVPSFEKKVSNYCGAEYGVAVNSATSALHIACLALGLGKGDYLWTSPNTFVASSNCGLYCGAKIDFVDIDKDTFNINKVSVVKLHLTFTILPQTNIHTYHLMSFDIISQGVDSLFPSILPRGNMRSVLFASFLILKSRM